MTKTIAEKLQIKPNTTVWVSDPGRITLLTPMPEGVRESDSMATASTAVLFAEDAASARKLMEQHAADATRPRVCWLAYREGDTTDLDRDALGPIVAEFGMWPDGQVAIDSRWSALRLRPDPEEAGS